MKTIVEVIQLSSTYLKMDRARRIAEELLSHILGLKRMELYLQFDRPVVESELEKMRELLKRVAKGEPVEYVTGVVDFLGCNIKVDKRVLIPRQETEILVDLVLKRIGDGVLWDVCTGSGCIGIAIKKARPDLTVVLSDISKSALEVARENARLNEVEVEILEGDLLQPFKGRKADYLICNPPYISKNEYTNLDPSVRDFEPVQALVGGEEGTEYYQRLNLELDPYLNPKGQVFLEIGAGQEKALKELFVNRPHEVLKDWAGHPRFFFLEKQ